MFGSLEFWLFVFVVVLVHSLTRGRVQNIVLLFASYLIYIYLDWRFVALLAGVTMFNFWLAKRLHPEHPHRRQYLWSGILLNVGILGFFKYFGDLAHIFQPLLIKLGLSNPAVASLVLPLGLSFYTFRVLSYLFDVYNKQLVATNDLVSFAIYIAFFPQIASGPIVRSRPFLTSLQSTRKFSQQQLIDGLTLIFIGLFYKVAIADPLSGNVAQVFSNLTTMSRASILIGIISYSIRIYADFAGYSLLAIGVTIWFGLPTRDNFQQPYFSHSVTQFWTRWHMSLSSWIRDYMFFPLTRALLRRWGSRSAFFIQAIGYLSTMIVIGLWHGTGWTFVIWGTLHGCYLLGERSLTTISQRLAPGVNFGKNFLVLIIGTISTWILVSVAWVFFRAESVTQALLTFQRLFVSSANPTLPSLHWDTLLLPIFLLLLVDLPQAATKKPLFIWQLRPVWRIALFTLMALSLFILGSNTHEPFIYFGF